jgi:phosphopantothenoylcysteine decarboxylase/phosphopantothenate--cysteine ligase
VFVATAAVADWRPDTVADAKLKKKPGQTAPALPLTENPDILAIVAQQAPAPAPGRERALYCVGFAAESHDLARHAREKRLRKGIPLIVGNLGPATFGLDHNALLLVDEHGEHEMPHADKLSLARGLVREIAARLGAAKS